MEAWQLILSSGVAVAIVTALKEIMMWRLNTGKKNYDYRLMNIEQNLENTKAQIDRLMAGNREALRDRIEYLAGVYIKRGCVLMNELDGLKRLHAAYHNLGGNGYLDGLLERVDALEIQK